MREWHKGLLLFGGVTAGTMVYQHLKTRQFKRELEIVTSNVAAGIMDGFDIVEERAKAALTDMTPSFLRGRDTDAIAEQYATEHTTAAILEEEQRLGREMSELEREAFLMESARRYKNAAEDDSWF